MTPGVPQLTHDTLSVEEKEAIIQYLVANFGPGSTPRDLLLDPLVRDERALSQAVYIQRLTRRVRRRVVWGRGVVARVVPNGSCHRPSAWGSGEISSDTPSGRSPPGRSFDRFVHQGPTATAFRTAVRVERIMPPCAESALLRGRSS